MRRLLPWLGVAIVGTLLMALLARNEPHRQEFERGRSTPPEPQAPGLAITPALQRATPAVVPPGMLGVPSAADDEHAVARARLLAVDGITGEPIDPKNRFTARTADEQGGMKLHLDSEGVLEVTARGPAGSSAVEALVELHGWGYVPFQEWIPLRVRSDAGRDEIRVPLRPISPDAWVDAALVLEGEGPVSEDEAVSIRVSAGPPKSDRPRTFPPSVLVPFPPGGTRTREIRVPEGLGEIAVETLAFDGSDGRRVLVDSRQTAKVRREDQDGRSIAKVARQKGSTLLINIRRSGPQSDFQLWGSWNIPMSPGSTRRVVTTYSVSVAGAVEVLRLVRSDGILSNLRADAHRLRGTMSPSGPFAFGPPSSTDLSATLTLEPDEDGAAGR